MTPISTMLRRQVLDALERRGPLTTLELARELGRAKRSVVYQCRALAELDLLLDTRREGRSVWVLTEAGRQALDEAVT